MKVSKNKFRAISLSIISLLFLSFVLLGYHSIRLSNKLDQERLEKESLLSEKIHLNRSLEELMKEISDVSERNRELSSILEANRHQSKGK